MYLKRGLLKNWQANMQDPAAQKLPSDLSFILFGDNKYLH